MVKKGLRRRPIIALGLSLLLLRASWAGAWGRWQHELIGVIAEQNLTPSAREKIKGILGLNTHLSDVANWPDRVRGSRPHTAPWHYVNYPLGLDEPDYDIMAQPEGNVVWAIEKQVAILKNPAAGRSAQEEALKFLTHFVGDLHQPMHCGTAEDRGGNDVPVKWRGRSINLHSLWDIMIFTGKESELALQAGELQENLLPGTRSAILRGRPYDWMVESHLLARNFCYGQSRLSSLSSRRGRILRCSNDYVQAARQLARDQILKAGLRLALLLNDIFGEEKINPLPPVPGSSSPVLH